MDIARLITDRSLKVDASGIRRVFDLGAKLKDPSKLFNSSLDAGTRRAIDIREGEAVDADAFKDLIREAVALNGAKIRP